MFAFTFGELLCQPAVVVTSAFGDRTRCERDKALKLLDNLGMRMCRPYLSYHISMVYLAQTYEN